MIFGQSVFQSVLNRLRDETENDDATDEDGGNGRFTIRGLPTGFVVAQTAAEADMGQSGVEARYLDNTLDGVAPETPQEKPIPAHLQRTSQEEVASELSISIRDTAATLAEKRRQFARTNHPDCVSPALRANANTRMTIANLLIDEAISRLAR